MNIIIYEHIAEQKARTERAVMHYTKNAQDTIQHTVTITAQYITSLTAFNQYQRNSKSYLRTKTRLRNKRHRKPTKQQTSIVSNSETDDEYIPEKLQNTDTTTTNVPAPQDIMQQMQQMQRLQEQIAQFTQLQTSINPLQSNAITTTTTNNNNKYVDIDPNRPPPPDDLIELIDIEKNKQKSFKIQINTNCNTNVSRGIYVSSRPRKVNNLSSQHNSKDATDMSSRSSQQHNELMKAIRERRNTNTIPRLSVIDENSKLSNTNTSNSSDLCSLIRVSGKNSLRKISIERTPGGTPIKRPNYHTDTIFSKKLQEKFKNLHQYAAVEELSTNVDTNTLRLSEESVSDRENWD